ncbi:hypothetical protein J2755_000590 [Methanohalophilus levihalophilus]|uniref:hypothetical protein n=1 Tax=Methanohalophilus levihalophilus TaxID=1431282 RepID=UPI001AE3D64D|nr:hypothetical protein [Methanohalophilus levihalophilus]MBP2029670.1 hypothetical protein [Methanohalophilus levihalophilus]
MKMKILLTILLVIAIAFAGCTEEPTKNETPTDGDNATPEDNESGTDNGDEVETPEEAYEPQDYPIRLKNYNAISANPLEINRTDTVTWINQQEDPKRFFSIENEEGLWDDVSISFMQKFTYQFNETGEYHTYVPPWRGMNVTIIVK